MAQTLPDRIRRSPGLSVGIVTGLLIGFSTGSWILWLVIGAILGMAWDRRKRRGY